MAGLAFALGRQAEPGRLGEHAERAGGGGDIVPSCTDTLGPPTASKAAARHTGPQVHRAHQECGASDRRDRALTVLLTNSNAFEILLKAFAGNGWMDGEIVRKEKKQKKKFSEPDFLRS